MTIRLDSTQISIVVRCSECPWWSGFADTKVEGWRVGAGHDDRVHPANRQASDALSKARRHAG